VVDGPIASDQIRAGCYEPAARLADMDLNHVRSLAVLPHFSPLLRPALCRTFRQELALACVRAYNDWMVDEWSATRTAG